MKRLALAIVLAGIFVLLLMLNLSSPKIVHNPSELSGLVDNSKVQTQGKVISERTLYGNTKLLKLENSIEILCPACPPYINRTLDVIGTSETYLNKSQISALKIKKSLS